MSRTLLLLLALCLSLPVAASPKVVASIAPLHSLVSGVMGGVSQPRLLIGGGASPHAYALKPSDIRALSDADLVVWVGEGLEAAVLERPLQSLAGKVRVLKMSALEGVRLLPTREGGRWEEHSGEREGHSDAHAEVDTHLWLSPHNAQRVVAEVAYSLAQIDPANAEQYQANAEGLSRRIAGLEQRLVKQLAPIRERHYIVFHDAYHYFEEAFGLQPAGAIAVSPERRPGARRIIEIRKTIRDLDVVCVFSEPQFRPDIVEVVMEGSQARHGVLDPLGASFAPGKEQWFALMQGLADSLNGCLAGAS